MNSDDQPRHATEFLTAAAHTIGQRGKTYDAKGEERSMGATVQAFNIITRRTGERALSESEGWLLMQILKDVRQWSGPEYHPDSAMDCVGYAALKGEALARGIGVASEKIDAACRDPLPLLPIVVGGQYRKRNGSVTAIVFDDGMAAPFKDVDGFWYYPSGKLCGSVGDHSFDLVERIS